MTDEVHTLQRTSSGCPSWCTLPHDEMNRNLELNLGVPGQAPVHGSEPTVVSVAVSVSISQVEGHDPVPGLLIQRPADFVTEAEAHELALVLLRLADQLRRERLAGDK